MAQSIIINFTFRKTIYYYLAFVFSFFESLELLKLISDKPIVKFRINGKEIITKLSDLNEFKTLINGNT